MGSWSDGLPWAHQLEVLRSKKSGHNLGSNLHAGDHWIWRPCRWNIHEDRLFELNREQFRRCSRFQHCTAKPGLLRKRVMRRTWILQQRQLRLRKRLRRECMPIRGPCGVFLPLHLLRWSGLHRARPRLRDGLNLPFQLCKRLPHQLRCLSSRRYLGKAHGWLRHPLGQRWQSNIRLQSCSCWRAARGRLLCHAVLLDIRNGAPPQGSHSTLSLSPSLDGIRSAWPSFVHFPWSHIAVLTVFLPLLTIPPSLRLSGSNRQTLQVHTLPL